MARALNSVLSYRSAAPIPPSAWQWQGSKGRGKDSLRQLSAPGLATRIRSPQQDVSFARVYGAPGGIGLSGLPGAETGGYAHELDWAVLDLGTLAPPSPLAWV